MKVELRENSVHISGYVNAVERNSKLLRENINGKPTSFYERIKRGVFTKALSRNHDVKVLLNHDDTRELATTADGSAELREDTIGLHAEVDITDAEVIKAAQENRLVGWSFGFYCNASEQGDFNGDYIRTVTDLDLIEVSILDSTRTPAYDGTLIEAREAREARTLCLRDMEEEPDVEPEAEAEETPAEENADDKNEIDLVGELEALKEMINELLEKIGTPEKETEQEPETDPDTESEDEPDNSAQSREAETSVELDTKQARDDTVPVCFDYTDYERRLNALKKGL